MSETGGLNGEFMGLIETAFGAARPVEGDGNEQVDRGLGLFGNLGDGVVKERGKQTGNFPCSGEFEAVDEDNEGFGEGANAGCLADSSITLVAAMAFVVVVVVCIGANGKATAATVVLCRKLGDLKTCCRGKAGFRCEGLRISPAGRGEEDVQEGLCWEFEQSSEMHGEIVNRK